jgi:hypothetical protein
MPGFLLCIKSSDKKHNFAFVDKLTFEECTLLVDLNRNAKIAFILNGKPCIFSVHELIIKTVNIDEYPMINGLISNVGEYDVEDFKKKLFDCVKKYDMDKYKEQVIVIMNIEGKNFKINKLVTMGIRLHEMITYFKNYDICRAQGLGNSGSLLGPKDPTKSDIVVKLSINDVDSDDDDEEISFKIADVNFEVLDSSYFDAYNQIYHFVNDNQNSTIKYMLTNIINFINKKLGSYYDNSFYVEAFEAFKESLL